MGIKVDGIADSNIKQSESKTGTTATADTSGNRSSQTTATGTGSGSTGTGSGTAGTGSGSTGTGSGSIETGRTETVKAKKNSKVSVLENLPEVNIPEPQEPKKKRTYTKRTKKTDEKADTLNSEQITSLIVAVSSMVASREGCSHWLITEAEAKQIAEPLSNIIEKSESLKSLGEHADAFALVTACIMIFAPRLIITFQTNKSKKGVKKINGKHNDKQSSSSNSEVSRKDAVTPSNVGSPIFESISAIQ